MSSDRTPADVIADDALIALSAIFAEPGPMSAHDVAVGLAELGFRVTPIPDDNSRAEVAELVAMLSGANEAHGWTVQGRIIDLLTAAYLDPEGSATDGHG